MPLTLTPLRYPGGKSKYGKLFVDIVSLNALSDITFVEVFAGGAGAAISLLLNGHVKSLCLNDLDVAIYSFWKTVKDNPYELIKLIRRTRVSMAEWHRQKSIYDRKDTSDILGLAFATFYLNRCNHSGILEARPIGGMKQRGSYKISARFNKATAIKKIERIARYADSIEVFNLDGTELLRCLNRKYQNRSCLIYLDPPYFQKGPDLYLNHFSQDDHKSLRDSILECHFPWVLSYDNHTSIIEMYQEKDCFLYRNQIRHTISGNIQAKELIISKLQLPSYLKQVRPCLMQKRTIL